MFYFMWGIRGVVKIGNSFFVCIPRDLVSARKWYAGSRIAYWTGADGSICIGSERECWEATKGPGGEVIAKNIKSEDR